MAFPMLGETRDQQNKQFSIDSMEKTANSFLIDLSIHHCVKKPWCGQPARLEPPDMTNHLVGCSRPGLAVAVAACSRLATVRIVTPESRSRLSIIIAVHFDPVLQSLHCTDTVQRLYTY